MATRSSILAWKIRWTEEPGGLYSPWSRKESDTSEHICILQKQQKMIHVDIWQHQHNIVKQFLFS